MGAGKGRSVLGSLTNLAQTKRLIIRAPQVGDFQGIAALWTDPEVTKYVGGPREVSALCDHFEQYAADPERFFAQEHECWWSVIDLSSRAFAGLCALIWKDVEGRTETELGYFLFRQFWGRGYAGEAVRAVISYAFGGLGLPSLVAIIHPDNKASRAVAKRLGMHLEQEVLRPDGVVRQVYRLYSPDHQ